jgi:membrane-associated phospholipid phosphatase
MPILDLGIEIIVFIQGWGTWLLPSMGIFSFLGQNTFYLLFLTVLYWSINSKAGLRLGLILMASSGLNYLFKLGLRSPRPYWYDGRVLALSVEGTFGVPSGHAQNAVVLWGFGAHAVRQKRAWVGAVILIFFIGFSRLYLGVHFPHDVLLGWLIGITVLWLFLKFEPAGARWLASISRTGQILVAFIASLSIIGAAFLAQMSLVGWDLPEIWALTAAEAAPDAAPINPTTLADVVSGAGAFFGLAAGAIFLSWAGGYSAAGPGLHRVLRLPMGLAGAGILILGLGLLMPHPGNSLAPFFQYLLYGTAGFWISAGAPLVFIKLGLASPAPPGQNQLPPV